MVCMMCFNMDFGRKMACESVCVEKFRYHLYPMFSCKSMQGKDE